MASNCNLSDRFNQDASGTTRPGFSYASHIHGDIWCSYLAHLRHRKHVWDTSWALGSVRACAFRHLLFGSLAMPCCFLFKQVVFANQFILASKPRSLWDIAFPLGNIPCAHEIWNRKLHLLSRCLQGVWSNTFWLPKETHVFWVSANLWIAYRKFWNKQNSESLKQIT